MASTAKEDEDTFSYIECPFSVITGCNNTMIHNGYCAVGSYCTQDCKYAWLPKRDDA
jgi:hypothetical protein